MNDDTKRNESTVTGERKAARVNTNIRKIAVEVSWLGRPEYSAHPDDNISVSWEDENENRFHVWLRWAKQGDVVYAKDRNGFDLTIADDSGGVIFKNPPEGVKSGTDGYFSTKKLNPLAQRWTKVLAFVFTVVEEAKLLSLAYASLERKEALEAAARARKTESEKEAERFAKFAPDMLRDLKLVLALNRQPYSACVKRDRFREKNPYSTSAYFVDLDPKALEQIERTVAAVEGRPTKNS